MTLAVSRACRLNLTLLLGFAWAGAAAQERHLYLGGEGSGRDFYTYAGTTVPFPRNRIGNGWVQRYWLDYYGYQYEGGPGKVDARAWGLEGLLGYTTTTAGGAWGGVYMGARYSSTDLSPNDPAAEVNGGAFGAKLQIEGETPVATNLRLSGIASYVTATSGYWARARALYAMPNGLRTGPEMVVAGNPEYDAQRYGLVVGGFRVLGATLDLKGGYSTGSSGSSAYGGLEVFVPY